LTPPPDLDECGDARAEEIMGTRTCWMISI
jgi:hypothetical protein